MFVKIEGRLYNSEEQPILLIFSDDNSRKEVATHLSNMEDKNAIRKYLSAPSGFGEDRLRELLNLPEAEEKIIISPKTKSE